ncbi:hypothetical protein LX77_00563 [Gelidibacter algens]|uniref:Uncharacterized protein n=1 Tax=Gelidibacter algens TaxID=49280 RepID=A0A1A7R473_9FLAO|nr:hypothetical protein A9996_01385 [Gelidibacter algens]RAJ27988.1 hypothetical protein LX77_00563 [Gelidibacter algens]
MMMPNKENAAVKRIKLDGIYFDNNAIINSNLDPIFDTMVNEFSLKNTKINLNTFMCILGQVEFTCIN